MTTSSTRRRGATADAASRATADGIVSTFLVIQCSIFTRDAHSVVADPSRIHTQGAAWASFRAESLHRVSGD
jgi:hypothetical protein